MPKDMIDIEQRMTTARPSLAPFASGRRWPARDRRSPSRARCACS